MSDDTCDTCGRPLATDADEQVTAPGPGVVVVHGKRPSGQPRTVFGAV